MDSMLHNGRIGLADDLTLPASGLTIGSLLRTQVRLTPQAPAIVDGEGKPRFTPDRARPRLLSSVEERSMSGREAAQDVVDVVEDTSVSAWLRRSGRSSRFLRQLG